MVAIIILLGAPGAGKGTQAVRLASALSLPHVSTGDLFRLHLREGSPLGQEARGFMDQGRLVPDRIVLDMLSERIEAADCEAGYLLDGFPRTLPQAEALEAKIAGNDDVHVIDLEVADETLVERLSGRLLCRGCGNIQHRTFSPPAAEGVCDSCGGELYQRDDDSADVVRERLRVYHEETEPLVQFYRDRGVLRTVDGEQAPDQVYEQLVSIVRGEG